jgi:hypothetical protein
VAGLDAREQEFLLTFYNAAALQMIDQTMRLGLPLSSLGKESWELDNYLLLLPLLHSQTQFDARLLDALPSGLLSPERLGHMADFCLLRLGRLDAAAAIGVRVVGREPSKEAIYQYYVDAASKCRQQHLLARAAQCLEQAVALLAPEDLKSIEARFRLCETYDENKSYAQAAGQAGQIAKYTAGTDNAGKATFLRLKYFAKQQDSKAVLLEADDALASKPCGPYVADLMYLKWWALRAEGKGEQASQVLQIFLKSYADSPYAAEMYYAVAVDCLSAQRYDEALTILKSLTEKFPLSPVAKRAKALLAKLQTQM